MSRSSNAPTTWSATCSARSSPSRSHPIGMARFGLRALQPATWIARRWKSDEARGLFAGMAAHAISPLNLPTTGALGMMFGVFGHAYGWPVAIGGSGVDRQRPRVGAARRRRQGRDRSPGHRAARRRRRPVRHVARPGARARRPTDCPDEWPARSGAGSTDRRRSRSTSPSRAASRGRTRRLTGAGTVHLGGTIEEIVAADTDAVNGRMPERPFVLAVPAVPRRPVALGRATCTRSGRTGTCRTATPATRPRRSSTRSSGSRRASASASWPRSIRTPARGLRRERELHRRRHDRWRRHPVADGVPATGQPQPVLARPRACTSARRPRRPVVACTAWPATTPRSRRSDPSRHPGNFVSP